MSNLAYVIKLIEKALASQLNSYLTNNNLCEVYQSAYRQGYITETALFTCSKWHYLCHQSAEGRIARYDRPVSCFWHCGALLSPFKTYLDQESLECDTCICKNKIRILQFFIMWPYINTDQQAPVHTKHSSQNINWYWKIQSQHTSPPVTSLVACGTANQVQGTGSGVQEYQQYSPLLPWRACNSICAK